MPKTVCIIGAGPSGLAAAKSLLHDAPAGIFRVTLFDAQPRIGGLWPSGPDDEAGLTHPRMLANQSRHTVQFSDLAWEADAPQFPAAWQLGEYLERYRQRYCGEAEVRVGCRVDKAELGEGGRWKVSVTEGGEAKDAGVFDYLIVASGFFASPKLPDGLPKKPEVPVVHSTRYRSLQTLFPKADGMGGKIVVVGGQISGIEIAGTIANQLSSAVNSPEPSPIPHPERYTLHTVIQRPAWVFPTFTSPKPRLAAPPFLPLDLGAYNMANRPHPLMNTQGQFTLETGRTTHAIYEVAVGGDQSDFSPAVGVAKEDHDDPPYLAVSDTFLYHVASGLVTVSKGKFASLSGNSVRLSPNGEEIRDVAAVIMATGFDTPLSFLPASVQSTLALDPSQSTLPVALAFHGTYHPALPTLGFVGFYRAAYWGVIELQARLVTALWTNPTSPSLVTAFANDHSIDRTLAIRKDPRRCQFPMGDYAYLMQGLANALDLPITPMKPTSPLPHNGKPMDILIPARYPPAHMNPSQHAENTESLRQLHETATASLDRGAFVPHAVFRSLLGTWDLRRTLRSRLPSHPSGEFTGTARFLLREGTSDGRDASFDAARPGWEYLYIEEGTFAADSGLRFPATRRYVWRYDEARDKLSVWFVRTDDEVRADYLFHEVEFAVPPPPLLSESGSSSTASSAVSSSVAGQVDGVEAGEGAPAEGRGWMATAGHLCEVDYYDVQYEFCFKAVNLREWTVGYTVKGPKKDYSIEGVYRRAGRA